MRWRSYGDRRQRADQRTHQEEIAQRYHAASGDCSATNGRATILDSNITTLIADRAVHVRQPARCAALRSSLPCSYIDVQRGSGFRAWVNLRFRRAAQARKLPIGNTDWYKRQKAA